MVKIGIIVDSRKKAKLVGRFFNLLWQAFNRLSPHTFPLGWNVNPTSIFIQGILKVKCIWYRKDAVRGYRFDTVMCFGEFTDKEKYEIELCTNINREQSRFELK